MIKQPPSRIKPRVKKIDKSDIDGRFEQGGDTPTDTSSVSSKVKAKPNSIARRPNRRPSYKKKDQENDLTDSPGPRTQTSNKSRSPSSPSNSFIPLSEMDIEHTFDRVPRLLPEIDGILPLSNSEVQSDMVMIETALSAFEDRLALIDNGRYNKNETSSHKMYQMPLSMKPTKRSRPRTALGPNGRLQLTPEEVIESLPVCRRAVRITQRELVRLVRERDDLERDFMRLRCHAVHEVSEMTRLQKQQDQVMRALTARVDRKAKNLESSRRRTTALQDIMTELDVRGDLIMRLTRDKHVLERLCKENDVAIPDPEEIQIGDRVDCPFGQGIVSNLDVEKHEVIINLDRGGTAYIQGDEVDVIPCEITYLEREKELKQKLFEDIGSLVQTSSGRNSGTTSNSSRWRWRNDMHSGEVDELEDEIDDESESGDEEELEDDDDEDKDRKAEREKDAKKKKRKLVLPSSVSYSQRKRQKSGKQQIIEFTACTIPTTPYEQQLLISPLSVLPDKTAAIVVGQETGSLQWLAKHMPSKLAEWEKERYESLQMKAEIERLRFQLQKVEAEKVDAQQHASDQLESINQLVTQLDKLRETTSTCSTCNSNGTKKSSTVNSRGAQSKSSNTNSKKENSKRQRTESIDEEQGADTEETESNSVEKRDESVENEEKSKSEDIQSVDDGSDGNNTTQVPQRALRPRRRPQNLSSPSPK